jgi:hypothetical protein
MQLGLIRPCSFREVLELFYFLILYTKINQIIPNLTGIVSSDILALHPRWLLLLKNNRNVLNGLHF